MRITPDVVIEAALLAHRTVLSMRDLRRLFNDRLSVKEIRQQLDVLRARWKDRGVDLVEVAGGWQFVTNPGMGRYLARLSDEKPVKYSRAAMEVLAIIAYKQPVTRAEIEAIRGVSVNPHILKQFEERGWVQVVGHRESPGRPELLGTTKQFLRELGLKTLSDLPALPAQEDWSTPQEPDSSVNQEALEFNQHDEENVALDDERSSPDAGEWRT